MWINRKAYDELIHRIKLLEEWRCGKDLGDALQFNFDVCEEPPPGLAYIPHVLSYSGTTKLHVKDAIRLILNHLGLKFIYIKGQPTRAELTAKLDARTKERHIRK